MKSAPDTALARKDAYLRKRPTRQLIEDFILSGMWYANDPHISTIRGWIMKELERRDPEAYEKWLDQECPEDTDLREYFSAHRGVD